MNVKIALELSKIVHENCKDVPHDIGILLSEKVDEILKEDVFYVPTKDKYKNIEPLNNYFFASNGNACDKCSSNPKNGGSGMCNCILGMPLIR